LVDECRPNNVKIITDNVRRKEDPRNMDRRLICSGGSGVYIGGQWVGHNCSWGGTDLYCHSEPLL